MKHIIMYSGGITSWATAKRVIQEHGKEDVVLLFADTLIEDVSVYEFLRQSSGQFGIQITRIADGRDPWQVFFDKRFLGNSRIDPCSDVLKRKLIRKWVESNFKHDECLIYFGIDWTESHRFERTSDRWEPYQCKAPLCAPPYMLKKDLIQDAIKDGLTPPAAYQDGFSHANCGGFCVKAGQGQFALLYKNNKQLFLYHAEREREFQEKIAPATILRETVNGERKNLSLLELADRIENGAKQIDLFEIGGCGCALE